MLQFLLEEIRKNTANNLFGFGLIFLFNILIIYLLFQELYAILFWNRSTGTVIDRRPFVGQGQNLAGSVYYIVSYSIADETINSRLQGAFLRGSFSVGEVIPIMINPAIRVNCRLYAFPRTLLEILAFWSLILFISFDFIKKAFLDFH